MPTLEVSIWGARCADLMKPFIAGRESEEGCVGWVESEQTADKDEATSGSRMSAGVAKARKPQAALGLLFHCAYDDKIRQRWQFKRLSSVHRISCTFSPFPPFLFLPFSLPQDLMVRPERVRAGRFSCSSPGHAPSPTTQRLSRSAPRHRRTRLGLVWRVISAFNIGKAKRKRELTHLLRLGVADRLVDGENKARRLNRRAERIRLDETRLPDELEKEVQASAWEGEDGDERAIAPSPCCP